MLQRLVENDKESSVNDSEVGIVQPIARHCAQGEQALWSLRYAPAMQFLSADVLHPLYRTTSSRPSPLVNNLPASSSSLSIYLLVS